MSKHIVIVRTSGSIIDINTYNCQEIGLAKQLAKQGFKISLVFAGKSYTHHQIKDDFMHPIDIFMLPYIAANQSISWFIGLNRLLKSISPDLIQVHDLGMFMSFYVVLFAKKHKIPSVLIQGTYKITEKKFYSYLENAFNRTFGVYILKNVHEIGCKTHMASIFLNKYKRCNTLLTPVGLDVSKFTSLSDRNWKVDLNLEDKKILLYVGVLEKRRNVSFLLKILESLPNDYILLIAGSGPERDNLIQQTQEADLTERCRFLGKRSQQEVASLYKSADLFLLPSLYEIYGMVLLEAMYFGLPIVSSVSAGAQIIIKDGKTGFIISDFTVSTWVKTILSVFDSRGFYLEMSLAARNRANEKFVWERAVHKYIELYG